MIVNVCVTSVAAAKVLLPACEAMIVHTPVPNMRTDPGVDPPTSDDPVVTEQTVAGDAVNANNKFDAVVLALIENGVDEYATGLDKDPNVIDCATLEMTKVTDVAPWA